MLLGGVFGSAGIAAQDSIRSLSDFEYIKNQEAWFTSDNAAGLHTLPVKDVSIAEVYLNKSNGKFINYFESGDSYQYGGKAESYFRMNPKVVLYGYVEYSRFVGKEMSGSAFIDPYYMPFDIVEMSDENSGKKELERYHLAGAISAEVYKGLRLGGKIDYLTGNYAKIKDLRHQNTLMDMYLTLGASYQINPLIEIGANYFYRRNTEGMNFKTYGNTDRQYYSLISFGSFYGRSELFGDSGYTSKTSGTTPVFNQFNGGAVQLNLNLSPKVNLFNEFTYKSRDGYYGIKSSTTIQYTRHEGNLLEYNGMFSLKTKSDLHSVRLVAGLEKLDNYEKIYKRITTSAGNTIIEYYGETQMLERKDINAGIEYTGNIGLKDNHPTWVLKAGGNFSSREQTVSVYPYYRKQTIRSFVGNVSARRSIFSGNNIYSISLGAGYGSGSGTPNNDGLYATPSSSQKEPESSDMHLNREYEYLTASRFGINAGFKFDTPVSQSVNGYVGLDCSFTKAMDIKYLQGSSYTSATIKIGCSF
ncbi:hypothetical protein GGR21_001240 [Dysgonomonas hofstadii]|uniref:DUF6850 domain-containing protein n=2 Tax=Dysgonomonas hofstadii TaxID=637886 RepID=A0A840CJK3_9BACT|nr:hypothetical protein [Dysgonomonas hofstadii]